jgi:hypothetical protein
MKKISALILAISTGLAAQAQLIDPLTGTLSPYTAPTIILAQNSDAAINFATTGTGLQASRTYSGTGSGAAQQDLLLRNDYSLTVGETLSVSVAISGTSAAGSDFGIAIASQVNPIPAVWTTGTVSTRSNYLAVYVKPATSEIGDIGFSGTTQVSSAHNLVASFTSINGLWITETAFDVFSIGYTTPSGSTTYASGITFSAGDIGNSIGFYADLRATETSPATFSNLTITPEPSTLALCGMGLAGMFGVMSRKKY